MDAKSRANFINSVASGNVIPCPKCGTSNKPDSKFCISCGTDLSTVSNSETNNIPAFEQSKESPAETKTINYVEPNTVFAQGLPEWSIEPPQVMVRRR